jgi:restriction endonuclease S subunit
MQLLLDEIAEVRMGLTLRGADAAKRTVKEGPHYLRISDLSEGGKLSISVTQPIDPALDPDHRHRVKAGDIVLANRGTRMTAALVPDNLDAVASSQLFVVRIKSPNILPSYLLAFLNLNSTQEHLRSHARGTYVQTLSIAILRTLEIPLLPLETQQKIASLSELADEERRLIAELSQKRAQFLNQSISRLLSTPS